MSLKVIEISKIEHENFLKQVEGFSFLQLPTWANVKEDWQGLSIGFYDDEELIGVGLLLSRVL
ncbi:MAG: peptidoglycan bridge formation glycyltransferase FemA/FemB family protein, partial [Candidatus Nanopelagicales bacterium]